MTEFVNVAMYVGDNPEAYERFNELYEKHFKYNVVLPEGQCAEQINAYVPEDFLPKFIAILDAQEEPLAHRINIYKFGALMRTHDRVPCSLLELTVLPIDKPLAQFEAEVKYFAPNTEFLLIDNETVGGLMYARVPQDKANIYAEVLEYVFPEISLATRVA